MLIPSESNNTINIQSTKSGKKIYITIIGNENIDITGVTWELNKKPPEKIIIGDNFFITLIYTYQYFKSLRLIKNFTTSSFRGGELLDYLAGPDTMFGEFIEPEEKKDSGALIPFFSIVGSIAVLSIGALMIFKMEDDEENDRKSK